MNQYVTGAMIKRLREEKKMTQTQLADKIGVSAKAVSKWETGRGYPDISLVEPLSRALSVSVIELFSGEGVINTNRGFNMLRTNMYVCPVCGNIIISTGEAVVCCCGINLPALEAEPSDESHEVIVRRIEDEYHVSVKHVMKKDHHISFIAAVKHDGYELKKLYPEGNAEVRFPVRGIKHILYYCNRHGLFSTKP